MTKPTHIGNKILDICVTDLGAYYLEPEIRCPVEPNDPSRCPSDHFPWILRPCRNSKVIPIRECTTKIVRPFTTECKTRLASYLQSESWEYVYDGRSSSDMAERFHNLMTLKINELCPTKVIKQNALSSGKPYFRQ